MTNLPLSVDRLAAAVDDPAEQFGAHRDLHRPPRRDHPSAGREAVGMSLGHQQDAAAVEPDNLGRHQPARLAFDKAALADRDMDAAGFHDKTDSAHQAAMYLRPVIRALQSRLVALEPRDQPLGKFCADRNHPSSSPSNRVSIAARQRDDSVRLTCETPSLVRGFQRRSLSCRSSPSATTRAPPISIVSSPTSKAPPASISGARLRTRSRSAGFSSTRGAPISIGTLATASRTSLTRNSRDRPTSSPITQRATSSASAATASSTRCSRTGSGAPSVPTIAAIRLTASIIFASPALTPSAKPAS